MEIDIKNQVTNLQISIKLKQQGVPQNSIFYWKYLNEDHCVLKYRPNHVIPNVWTGFKIFSAYTVSELGELLGIAPQATRTNNGWEISVGTLGIIYSDNEANARGAILSMKIDNMTIDVKDLKL